MLRGGPFAELSAALGVYLTFRPPHFIVARHSGKSCCARRLESKKIGLEPAFKGDYFQPFAIARGAA
jgi:hypothetical protein